MDIKMSNTLPAPAQWNFARKVLQASLLLLLALSAPAFALELDTAKDNGWVGERYTGYLGVVKPEAGVKALVDDVNQKRNQVYKGLAAKNNITLQEVEKIAGKKVIEKTKPGNLIDQGNGWLKK